MLIKRYTVLLLSVAAFVSSSILLLVISISTKYWKYVSIVKTNKTSSTVQQLSHSGLFHTCYTLNLIEPTKFGCELIELPNVENTSDNNTINAYYITLLSLLFPVASALTLIVATFACFYGFWSNKRRNCLLFASLFYVTSGLLNVVGLMCYINRTNDELGQLNKKEENTEPKYQYAWSFYMATVSFALTQVSAVLCIYFYNELLRIAKHILHDSAKNCSSFTAAAAGMHEAKMQQQQQQQQSLVKSNSLQHFGNTYDPTLVENQSKISSNQFSSLGNYVTTPNLYNEQCMTSPANISHLTSSLLPPPPNLSRPSSSVAMIPMSSMSNHRNAQDSFATTAAADCHLLQHASSFSNFSQTLLAEKPNDVTCHLPPIAVQKQNSVSSSASSPPQMTSGGNMHGGYCNGNIPGNNAPPPHYSVFSTPSHIIAGGVNITSGGNWSLNPGGAKSFLVNDTTV